MSFYTTVAYIPETLAGINKNIPENFQNKLKAENQSNVIPLVFLDRTGLEFSIFCFVVGYATSVIRLLT